MLDVRDVGALGDSIFAFHGDGELPTGESRVFTALNTWETSNTRCMSIFFSETFLLHIILLWGHEHECELPSFPYMQGACV